MTQELMYRLKYEIESLRRANQILAAKVSVVEVFAAALGLKPISQGEAVDVVWELQKEIDKINSEVVK